MKTSSTRVSIFLGMLLTLFTTKAMSQELISPTLEDLLPGGATYRYAANLYGLQWWGDVCIKPEIESLIAINPETGVETTLVTREAVNRILRREKLDTLSHFYRVSLPWAGQKLMRISQQGMEIIYDWENSRIQRKQSIPERAANKDYEPHTGQMAYTMNNNLYVNGHAVTNEESGIVCGQAVHRHEFGITKGTFWSPKGELLAFYRMDERMVEQYPLVDIARSPVGVTNIRYPMAGRQSHKVSIGIYNPRTDEKIYLNTGEATDRYFTNIAWAPDASSLYLVELNREQNEAKLCRYDARTGELTDVLYTETHRKYVEPQRPIVFLPWDDKKFIYQSQRDGYNHLYLFELDKPVRSYAYNTTGGGTYRENVKVTQLTQGNWVVKDIAGFDTDKQEVIVTSTENSPLRVNIFSVSTSRGKRKPIGVPEGVHTALVSQSGRFVIDTYSLPTEPRVINLIDTKRGRTMNLLTASNPFKGFLMPQIELGSIKAADHRTDLYYRMIRPADFDPTKKYPVVIYVYGGPHAQMVTGGWQYGARGWDLYMANKGYIVFTLDNRGSANRGLEFENVIYRQLGIEEGKDQLKGVDFLKSLPYVDADRIGVHGWSFGGHMTTALMLRYPKVFKVGVAGGPVIDWSYYEVMYGERYMSTPEANPLGYEETNLKRLAGKLQGRLLLIHDDHDDTCVPQHTLSFIKACVDARTYPDLFIYPNHKHNVLGKDRVHLYEKVTRYFDDYLY